MEGCGVVLSFPEFTHNIIFNFVTVEIHAYKELYFIYVVIPLTFDS